MKIIFLSLILIALIIPFGIAEENQTISEDAELDYDNLDEFIEDIPSLNEQIQSENLELPESAGYIMKNGNLYFNVSMNDGSTKEFYFTVEDEKITSVSAGKPEEIGYTIETTENASKKVLESEDKVSSILQAYEEKEIEVKANGFWNNVKLFFAKILLKVA